MRIFKKSKIFFLIVLGGISIFGWLWYLLLGSHSIRGVLPPLTEVVVLPHHGITAKNIDEYYQQLKSQYSYFDTIIIVSPDHFGLQSTPINTLPDSLSQVCYHDSCVHARSIEPYTRFSKEGTIFTVSGITHEHGIGEHIMRIARFFPETTVIPVTLQRSLNLGSREDTLARDIIRTLSGRTLVVASVDFSHHVHEEFAIFHDMMSIDALRSGTMSDLSRMEVDCRNCLGVVKILANALGKDDFRADLRTSVDLISGSGQDLNNTSHIFGQFITSTQKSSHEISGVFLFAGDTHWARTFLDFEKISGYKEKILKILYQLYDSKKSPDIYYHRIFSGFDDVMVNFESAIVSRQEECKKQSTLVHLVSYARILPVFSRLGISLVNLANNHSHDCGEGAFQKGLKLFESAGIKVSGYDLIDYRNIRGLNFAFVGINTTEMYFDRKKELSRIQSLTASGYIPIVNIHWGDEYSPHEGITQKRLAHELIDAGARLIIGHHPHVVQGIEKYKGIPIYYSLGNFLFDQSFPETLRGIFVACRISQTTTFCQDIPYRRDPKDFSLSFGK